ncbi:MAG: restriction endonuclease subunit M [Flavobacterium sp. MedPE-SWcel]|uniref:Eco57I restriction-modification methylase domain-containing protein n=1 Tax=uncultured Flavobacterium sp. TaxID=165435 RepID=UPI000920C0DA|nr:TaqI-like C-terminal specificity domain-containing protein [uncultured Flavobacterium sp.]OIQ15998.1 MAG: restriction endonuclease subunit M [Flavobacterium sp. MedPE-SWcel]
MPLFQNAVLTKYLKKLDKKTVDVQWEKYKAHFFNPVIQQNIRNSKEEQYQGGFLIDLFVNILGYTKNPQPNFNLTTEYKNIKDAKKADGAILIEGKAKAVIELKGTDTIDLGLKGLEYQAFGYKNNQPDCEYIITSNYEKLRFYIDNAVEHIEFNLFTLTRERFDLLYLCLAHENLSKGLAKKIKNDSLVEEDKITKKLYKDYSVFKRELHRNLVELNPEYEPLELFKKSQKLLDRFLFLFFAEDGQLLPPNSVRLILNQWNKLNDLDAYVPLYDRFKKYFGYLNTGHKGKEYDIFAYNGGLFKPDAILDAIKIDDDLLYNHTEKLSKYDFDSEVDVNILGHIFENSLNELEEVKAELEGETVDRTKTKRKKDGVFYTPKYITKYIVDNTVGKLCQDKKKALDINDETYQPANKRSRKRLDALQEYRDWLLQLTICDPACGSGAFLNQALDFLINEHRYVDELSASYNKDAFVLSDVENSILENNLFGVDINEESVEIAKLSLWLRTARPNRKLNSLSNNIKCGNSLIDDPAVAGDKAFDWQQEFPHIFKKGGFDVVIGNPPYVVYIKSILGNGVIDYVNKEFEYSEYNPNTYALFTDLALNKLIVNGGYLGFIIPNTWLDGQYFSKMRSKVYELDVEEIVYLKDTAFDEIVETVILLISNKSVNEQIVKLTTDIVSNNSYLSDLTLCELVNGFNPFTTKADQVVDKIEKDSFGKLSEHAIVYRGLETLNNKIWLSEAKDSINHIPILLGSDVNRYHLKHSGTYVNFIPQMMKSNANINMYKQPKILMRRTGSSIIASIDNENYMALKNLYLIIPNDVEKIYQILAQLNSSLFAYYHRLKTGGENKAFAQFKGTYILDFPIKFSDNLDFRTSLNYRLSYTTHLYDFTDKFCRMLQRKFELEKLPKKLQDWYELTYADFVKELRKKKIKLSLSEEAEWEDYFTTEQQKAVALKNKIDITDAEIDQMVYKLYDLTPDEIAIVEQG